MVAVKTAAAAVAAVLGALLLATAPVAAAGAVGVRNTVNCSVVDPPPCIGDTACALLVGSGSGNGAGRCVPGRLADAAMPCGPDAVGWMCISGNGHLRLRHRSKRDVAEQAKQAVAGATNDSGNAAAGARGATAFPAAMPPQPSPLASIVIADVELPDSAAALDAAAVDAANAARTDASFAANDAAAAADADAAAAAAAKAADAAAAAAAQMDADAAAAAEAAAAAVSTADELLSAAAPADGDEEEGGDAAGAAQATDAAQAAGAEETTDAPAAAGLTAMKERAQAAATRYTGGWAQPNHWGAVGDSFGHIYAREQRRAASEAAAARARDADGVSG